MIVGALLGGAVGNFGGAAFGGVIGAIVGGIIAFNSKVALDKRLASMEDAIKQLRAQVGELEAGATSSKQDAQPAAMPSAEIVASVVTSTPDAMPYPPTPEVPKPVGVVVTPSAASDVPEVTAVPAKPLPPQTPEEPSALWNFFFGGNTLVRVGIAVLFLGVAFLLKYATDRGFVPIELRLAAVAAGGIALLAFGWRLREKRAAYALMLQGGGVGVLYLTVFAGLRLYHLIPAGFAFVLLAFIAVFSALLAITQDSRALAITGVAGGFLAPILTSTGGGNHVALFSFYAVLNAGILLIAYYKAWRELNLVGFAFTSFIGLAWGAKYYQPDKFDTTEPFLILFFLMYVAIAMLFARRQAPKLTHYVDGTIVFGVPVVAFGLQSALMRGMEFGAAWSALGVAAIYLLLAMWLNARKHESLRLLVESFLALGIGFATLAVPLAFDGRWTSAVWAVEGAAIVWVGVRQGRILPRAFGMALQLAAGAAFMADNHNSPSVIPVLNSQYLGCVMIAVAGLFVSGYLERQRERIAELELVAARMLFVWGALWWFGGGMVEIDEHVKNHATFNAVLLFASGSCAAFAMLWQRLQWNIARFAALAILPLMVVTVLSIAGVGRLERHPFLGYAYIGWIVAFVVHFVILHRHEGRDERLIRWWHTAGFWLLVVIASWEFGWQIDHYVEGNRVWPLIAWALVPGAFVALFAARREALRWPVFEHKAAYLFYGALPVAVFVLVWVIYANFTSSGNPAPLPYVPLLNPLDLAQAGALLAVALWFIGVRRMELAGIKMPKAATALVILGIIVFIALNGVLLRTLHHYADVPFRFNAMMRNNLVQASLSVFWGLIAYSAMITAARRGLRALWFTGAALIAVVIAKLVLVDMSKSGAIEIVLSIIGVGIICVVVGYFAPLPPRAEKAV
jgi:uncharacterized membrane protein